MKNWISLALFGVVGYWIWNKFVRIPPDKRIEEHFAETRADQQLGFAANLLNNIRQLPVAFFGALPLQTVSANPLQKGNPVYDQTGDIQILPRVPGSEMFSTIVPPQPQRETFPDINDPGAFFLN